MNLKNVKAIFQREFRAYFDSPVAYVFLVAFLVLVGFLTGVGVQVFTGQIGKNRDLLHAELVQAQLAVRAAC